MYLVTFGYEYQSMVVEPGKAQLYLYAFELVKNKKAPFHVAVTVGREQFGFSYKE